MSTTPIHWDKQNKMVADALLKEIRLNSFGPFFLYFGIVVCATLLYSMKLTLQLRYTQARFPISLSQKHP